MFNQHLPKLTDPGNLNLLCDTQEGECCPHPRDKQYQGGSQARSLPVVGTHPEEEQESSGAN